MLFAPGLADLGAAPDGCSAVSRPFGHRAESREIVPGGGTRRRRCPPHQSRHIAIPGGNDRLARCSQGSKGGEAGSLSSIRASRRRTESGDGHLRGSRGGARRRVASAARTEGQAVARADSSAQSVLARAPIGVSRLRFQVKPAGPKIYARTEGGIHVPFHLVSLTRLRYGVQQLRTAQDAKPTGLIQRGPPDRRAGSYKGPPRCGPRRQNSIWLEAVLRSRGRVPKWRLTSTLLSGDKRHQRQIVSDPVKRYAGLKRKSP